MKKRVFKNKFYMTAETPGISGFQEWDNVELRIISGHKAMEENYRYRVVAEFIPEKIFCGSCLRGIDGHGMRFENGKLPNCQEFVLDEEIKKTLLEFPFNSLYVCKLTKSELEGYKGDPALKFFE